MELRGYFIPVIQKWVTSAVSDFYEYRMKNHSSLATMLIVVNIGRNNGLILKKMCPIRRCYCSSDECCNIYGNKRIIYIYIYISKVGHLSRG